MSDLPALLTDPFLQLPTASSVRVVWFTEFGGQNHRVQYGRELQHTVVAQTRQLSRTREDEDSFTTTAYTQTTRRLIWRHEAEVTGLTPGTWLPYRVVSQRDDGAEVYSQRFRLTPLPPVGTPLKILLTSDHQLKPMTAANLQKVVETVGSVDAVLFAGDLVNVPDRASEWFDDTRGNAFFPVMQGRAQFELTQNGCTTQYRGGAILQSAPLYAAIGNHEVMGRFSTTTSLREQFKDAVPRQSFAAVQQAASADAGHSDPKIANIKDQSFNTDTYEEILTLPHSSTGGPRYYAVTFGDLRLVVLYVTNVWRPPSLEPIVRGRYRERAADVAHPERWGYGQHIFEPIAPGSPQYQWLEQELQQPEFQQARFKVVMFHHPPHSLGTNSVPAYTDPVPVMERDTSGAIAAIRYEYPKPQDYIVRDVVPLLEQAGVQLVFYGHSHLWNRFTSSSGMHFLETSNVGNSYGAHWGDFRRVVPEGYQEEYVAIGNPNGLDPVIPAIAPLLDDQGQPLPYIASNDITVFSVLDTAMGTVSSYRFDTRAPQSPVIWFDEFSLRPRS